MLVNANLDIMSLKTALYDVSSIKKSAVFFTSFSLLSASQPSYLVKAHSDSGSLTLEGKRTV